MTMATESTQAPVNGTYHAHHHHANPYPGDPYAQHAHAAAAAAAGAAPPPPNANNVQQHHPQPTNSQVSQHSHDTKHDVAKDEVGWFFVEQYYTTLSRNPEKLHLFYSRRSQFVSGMEAEKVPVAVGQKAIHERIKELDYQEAKVRVLNVDSQASFDNILVSVIGEMSNKGEAPKKFIQAFVLAEQPNGYYVLNDMFRYLADEDEEAVAEEVAAQPGAVEVPAAAAAQAPAPQQPVVERQADNEEAAHEVDDKLEEAVVNGDTKPTVEEKIAQPEQTEECAPTAVPETGAVPVLHAGADAVQPEKPRSPEPSPAPTPQKAAAPAPEKENAPPAKPAGPMTWASIASNRAGGAPATAAAPVAQSKPAPAPAPAAPQAAVPQPAAETENAASQASSSTGSEWQTAGAEHNKRQARPQSVSGAGDDNVSAYIKNVTEKVDVNTLRQTLSRFGRLKYFDVYRQRSCAFVEFADPAAYKAAVAANPHQIGTEQITVEKRQRGGAGYGGPGCVPGRGGAGRGRGDGRQGNQGGRGGFQKDSGRFAPRGGRGGNVTPRGGRNQTQAA